MVYESLKELFSAICDSVRAKDGSVGLIDHQDIPDRILEIKGIDTSEATAGAMDIVKGKTACVKDRLVDGELKNIGATWMITNGSIELENRDSFIVGKTKTTEDFYSRAGTDIYVYINKNRFGNARPEDVVYGKTFTSEEGLVVPGTRLDVSADNWEEADSISDFHYWEKVAEGNDLIEEMVTDYCLSESTASMSIAYYGFTHYASEITTADGALALVDPVARGTIDKETLAGKYIQNGSDFYRVPDDVIIDRTNMSSQVKNVANRVFKLTYIASGKVSYVVSSDPDAFPQNGMKDGYSYAYKGTLNETGTKAVIAALTVTENGTYAAPAGVDGYSPITVNVTAGDIPAVSQAVPVIEFNPSDGLITVTATQDGGQVPAGTQSATKPLPTQAAKTYTPGAADQVIPSGKYLTGTQTIKGDGNLKAENIKDGVTIFGIKGSYAGDGSQGNGSIEVASLSELHYWTKTDLSSGGPQETFLSSVVIGTVNSMVSYADEITAAGDGLVNPQTYTVTKDAGAAKELLAGKYVKTANYLIRIPPEATFHFGTLSYVGDAVFVQGVYEITPGSEPIVSLIVNSNSAAYPENGELDGYKYVYQGTLSG